jgi:hypothetical protein
MNIDTAAAAVGLSGQPGCGPAAQGGKGPFPDGNQIAFEILSAFLPGFDVFNPPIPVSPLTRRLDL